MKNYLLGSILVILLGITGCGSETDTTTSTGNSETDATTSTGDSETDTTTSTGDSETDTTTSTGDSETDTTTIIGDSETDTTTITWKGVGYNTVTSPFTGREWLDRNLGASQVCTSSEDTACFGDSYQWGRDADGHEKRTSEISSTLASSINAGHGDFIISTTNPKDWVDPSIDRDGKLRSAKWYKVDGTSVCPIGYRVPTIQELVYETTDTNGSIVNNISEAFNNFLKIPASLVRDYRDGTFPYDTETRLYASDYGNVYESAQSLYIDAEEVFTETNNNAYGASVRCIKDIPEATRTITFTGTASDDYAVRETNEMVKSLALTTNSWVYMKGTFLSKTIELCSSNDALVHALNGMANVEAYEYAKSNDGETEIKGSDDTTWVNPRYEEISSKISNDGYFIIQASGSNPFVYFALYGTDPLADYEMNVGRTWDIDGDIELVITAGATRLEACAY